MSYGYSDSALYVHGGFPGSDEWAVQIEERIAVELPERREITAFIAHLSRALKASPMPAWSRRAEKVITDSPFAEPLIRMMTERLVAVGCVIDDANVEYARGAVCALPLLQDDADGTIELTYAIARLASSIDSESGRVVSEQLANAAFFALSRQAGLGARDALISLRSHVTSVRCEKQLANAIAVSSALDR